MSDHFAEAGSRDETLFSERQIAIMKGSDRPRRMTRKVLDGWLSKVATESTAFSVEAWRDMLHKGTDLADPEAVVEVRHGDTFILIRARAV